MVEADDTCRRIEHLTSRVLTKIAVSKLYGAWETLFQDPGDGRLWERTYPESGLHGGGPPRLKAISHSEALEKFELSSGPPNAK
jgi:hypothetical protein